ncbi:uncharacterized protein si:dkey-122a22.2 isoform X1 [Scyliorhinus canicula]|uniref:uncharacterized protein si:dkey-122a22.2 isoform X1 n=1 Tax=Scyliorhinus canicula TaxID=7830 RepID=UPI0018F42A67|nr:uncharacterized protein si:dkey-122a22.2 isoform X1 [Scyliorhinus canicula]
MRAALRKRQQHVPTQPPCVASQPAAQKNNTDQVCPTESNRESSSRLRVCPRLISVLKYLLLMLVIPPFLNYASLQREGTLLQPQEGELVDIGLGQKLYLNCQGKGHPVVIFDAPTGMSSDVWLWIQKDVSQLTQACIYDRAGLGFSKRIFQNETAGLKTLWRGSTTGRMVDDLHRLVKEAKLNSPFIFVGSELGALNARFYAHIHNWEVSDLILIDPIPEEAFMEDVWVQYWYKELLSYHQTQQFSAAIGLNRMLLIAGLVQPPVMGENISEDFMRRQKYLLSNPAHLSAVVDEHFFINESISQVRDILKFKPLSSTTTVTVITGDHYDEQLPDSLNKVVTQFQQQFIAQGYPSAKWIKMKGTDRRMIYRNPKDVAKQLKKLISKRKVEQERQ